MSAPVDVLAVLGDTQRVVDLCDPLLRARQHPMANSLEAQAFNVRYSLRDAIAAVAELIEAVSDVYGDEVNAGRGTCAPDCMSCRIQTALARVQGGAA